MWRASPGVVCAYPCVGHVTTRHRETSGVALLAGRVVCAARSAFLSPHNTAPMFGELLSPRVVALYSCTYERFYVVRHLRAPECWRAWLG